MDIGKEDESNHVFLPQINLRGCANGKKEHAKEKNSTPS
jgi:hypothetical protein